MIKQQIRIFLVIGFAFAMCNTGQAQQDDAYWKRLRDIQRGILQNDVVDTLGTYEEKVLEAIEPTIFLVEQEYVLAKGKKKFGRGNEDYFGKAVSVGILTEEGLLSSAYLTKPWVGDQEFELKSDEYDPELSITRLTSIPEMSKLEEDVLKKPPNALGYCAQYGVPNDFGPKIQHAQGQDSVGYLVLYHLKGVDSMDIDRTVLKLTVTWENGHAKLSEQVDLNEVIGGFFIVEKIGDAAIKFAVAGILSSFEGQSLELVNLEFDNHKSATKEPDGKPKSTELKEISPKKKEKNNN